MKPTIVILTGPTAAGKTAYALSLAQRFPLEIVGADSLQVFRTLDIGTAKPTATERSTVPHHMIDVLDPDEDASSAWYAAEARNVIAGILDRDHLPLIVGGAGFYLRALEHPPVASSTDHKTESVDIKTYAWLKEQDPDAAEKIHPNDRYRISRAVALLREGHRPSELWKRAETQDSPFELLWFGIAPDRPDLHRAIEQRLEAMFAGGLVEETDRVRTAFPGAVPRLRRAIGYRQALEVLEERSNRDEARKIAIYRSRQYAKRQMTWLRREPRLQWFTPQDAVDTISRQLETVQR